jgi:plastocyanin
MIIGNLKNILNPILCSITIVIVCSSVMPSSFTLNPLITAIAQTGERQPNINATSVFDTGQMILPNNVKHLVILIPNEGHHGPGEADESRFIAQPFVPQNTVVGPGTQVVWFSGDVGHDHNIVVKDLNGNNDTIFETGDFPELEASRPITFNNTGTFDYADTIDYEEGFRMTGKITVTDQQNNVASNRPEDTVGALMVPAEDSQQIVQGLRTAGLNIDSMTAFQDLRTAEDDDGDQQTLLIWTTNGKDMSEIISTLQELSEELPYG